MNKSVRNLTNIFIAAIFAFIVAGIYMYVERQKGALLDKSVIIYVLAKVIVSYITLMFFVFSIFYTVKRYVKTKNIFYGLPCVIVLGSILIAKIFFKEINTEQFNYNIYLDKRMVIIENIEKGIWRTHETARVELPFEYKEEEDSGLGRIFLVHTDKGNGIYFCLSSFIDSSSGYVFLTNHLPDDSKFMVDKTILFEEYGEGWYRCATYY